MAGRFAPSPTGPLHLGSLLAATASFLEARARGLPWRLRIDDLDAPRAMAHADAAILRALERHHLHWDGPVEYQSQRLELYEQALAALARRDMLFYCDCSRRHLRNTPVYPGTCRTRREPRPDSAVRVRIAKTCVEFVDLVQGAQRCELAAEVGDFIVRRRDDLIAYQLAAAVDDGSADIDHVVRGADLLDNTPRQIFLMHLLDLEPPAYAHVPVLTHPDGSKLSKQTHAAPVDGSRAGQNLALCLTLLGQRVPAELSRQPCADVVSWALTHWNLRHVPRVAHRVAPADAR